MLTAAVPMNSDLPARTGIPGQRMDPDAPLPGCVAPIFAHATTPQIVT